MKKKFRFGKEIALSIYTCTNLPIIFSSVLLLNG